MTHCYKVIYPLQAMLKNQLQAAAKMTRPRAELGLVHGTSINLF